MFNGIKSVYVQMNEVGLSLDTLFLEHLENGKRGCLTLHANKLPKHSSLNFEPEMLESENLNIIEFPEAKAEDVLNYTSRMHSVLKCYNETVIKIQKLEALLAKSNETGFDIKMFETLLQLNKDNLSKFRLEFAKEAKATKVIVDKSLNFLMLPTEITIETLRVHAYLRKLVDFKILSSSIEFKLFTNKFPDIIAKFQSDLGFLVLSEDDMKVLNEKNNK